MQTSVVWKWINAWEEKKKNDDDSTDKQGTSIYKQKKFLEERFTYVTLKDKKFFQLTSNPEIPHNLA